MTVALSDTMLLCDMLRPLPDFTDSLATAKTTHAFYTRRKPLSATINTLANALYQASLLMHTGHLPTGCDTANPNSALSCCPAAIAAVCSGRKGAGLKTPFYAWHKIPISTGLCLHAGQGSACMLL